MQLIMLLYNLYMSQRGALWLVLCSANCPITLDILLQEYKDEQYKQKIYRNNLVRRHLPQARDLRPVLSTKSSVARTTHPRHIKNHNPRFHLVYTSAKPNRTGNNIDVVQNQAQLGISELKCKKLLAQIHQARGLIRKA
jgi:hypothetical protein